MGPLLTRGDLNALIPREEAAVAECSRMKDAVIAIHDGAPKPPKRSWWRFGR